jgi:hypothetical protein
MIGGFLRLMAHVMGLVGVLEIGAWSLLVISGDAGNQWRML